MFLLFVGTLDFILCKLIILHVKRPISIVLQIFSLVILPNKFFKFFQTVKQRNTSSSVHKCRFQYPQIWRFSFLILRNKRFGHYRLTIKQPLGPFCLIIWSAVKVLMLSFGQTDRLHSMLSIIRWKVTIVKFNKIMKRNVVFPCCEVNYVC